MANIKDYYGILGIHSKASLGQIRTAYRQCALRAHPDRGGSHESMLQINEAFAILQDPETRARYDRAIQEQDNAAAQVAAVADAKEAAKQAGVYDRVWDDFKNAKYGKTEFGGFSFPTSGQSVSARIAIIVGGIVGIAVGGVLGALIVEHVRSGIVLKIAVLGGAAAGAWGGRVIHSHVGALKTESQANSNAAPVDAELVGEAERIVITCTRCSRRLRVLKTLAPLRVTCPRCRCSFDYSDSV